MARTDKKNRAWQNQEAIVKMHIDEGLGASRISHKFYEDTGIYVSNETIYRILKENGKFRPREFVNPNGNSYARNNEPQLADDYKSGMKLSDIRDKYSCSYKTIYLIVRKYNIELRPKTGPFLLKYKEQIEKDYYEGWLSIRALACKYGTNFQTIAAFMRKQAFKMRKQNCQISYRGRKNYGKGSYDMAEWSKNARELVRKNG